MHSLIAFTDERIMRLNYICSPYTLDIRNTGCTGGIGGRLRQVRKCQHGHNMKVE